MTPGSLVFRTDDKEYRNVDTKDGFAKIDGVDNLYQLLMRSVRQHGHRDCLGCCLFYSQKRGCGTAKP